MMHSREYHRSKFQSPSQRGGGTAAAIQPSAGRGEHRFNPLRKGEAAPPRLKRFSKDKPPRGFQSPSQRGGGAALPPDALYQGYGNAVSIPFAKGRRRRRWFGDWEIVSSSKVSIPFAKGRRRRRFSYSHGTACVDLVSIPFAKGRRRRRSFDRVPEPYQSEFQSPSQRGGGAAYFK